LGASLWLINDSTPFPGVSTLLPVAGTLLVILAGAKSNAVTGILATRPMVKVGDWSYSIYLWHWPLIVFAGILWPGRPRILLATALLSVGPALASYRWVEQPIRKVRNLSRPRLARIVVVTLAGPLIVSALLWVAASNGLWSQQIREYQAATMPTHVGFNAGCHTSVPISQRSMADCSWNQSATGRPVYLVGDSNADHFGEAVIGAGERLNRPVQIVTVNSCPFLDVYISMVPSSSSVFESCRSFYEDTLSWLEEQPPGLVIISFSDEAFRAADKAIGLTPDAESFDPSEKARSLSLGLRVTVTALQQSGHRVLLVQTVPHFVNPLYQPLRCPIPTLISGICGQDMPVEYTAQRQQDTRRAMQQVADETGATVLDLQGYLCPGGICSTRNSNLVLYRDDGHISVPASQSLAPQFAEAIKDAG
ncbi:MAG: acyltransferase family protein, partial [Actinomycetes bacterium]